MEDGEKLSSVSLEVHIYRALKMVHIRYTDGSNSVEYDYDDETDIGNAIQDYYDVYVKEW